MRGQRATAIFGGAFDPPHRGHVEVIRKLIEIPAIELVTVVPSLSPPHKSSVASYENRMLMAMKAFAVPFSPKVVVSDVEKVIEGQTTYTCDVLPYLPGWGKRKYALVLGTDEVRSLGSWKTPEKIFEHARLIIAERPGEAPISATAVANDPALHEAVKSAIVNATRIQVGESYNISSTKLRTWLSQRQDISSYVPATIINYILGLGLYGWNGRRS